LIGESISKDDYKKSEEIFKELNCKNLKEYMENYCTLDVYLLAEIFTIFRIQAIENFAIDPCNYISLPGFGLDCFLKSTDVVLDSINSGS